MTFVEAAELYEMSLVVDPIIVRSALRPFVSEVRTLPIDDPIRRTFDAAVVVTLRRLVPALV